LIKRRDDPSAPTFLLGYDSLPIRADKSLYVLAEWVGQNHALAQCIGSTPASQLVAMCESGIVPGDVTPVIWDEWRKRFHGHLREYGHMLYNLDFIHPVPADDPAPVLEALKLYLSGSGSDPFSRQRESAERREQAAATMRDRLKGLRLKWFNKYLASAQKYAPLREDGLAEIGLAYPLIRQMLRELGRRLAQRQVILAAEDIFWLTEDEVRQAAGGLDGAGSVESLAERSSATKAEHQAALRATPPVALPQMKVLGFDMMSLKDKRGRRNRGDVIKGVAASPGIASGAACILHGPEDFGPNETGRCIGCPDHHSRLDAALCDGIRNRDRCRWSALAWLHRGTRIWHPCRAGNRSCHKTRVEQRDRVHARLQNGQPQGRPQSRNAPARIGDHAPARGKIPVRSGACGRVNVHPARLHASNPDRGLVAALQAESTPEAIPAEDWREFKRRFEKYLDEFGHTTYEFDFMNPTPAETPAVILDALKLYAEGKGADPYARQREAARKARRTLRRSAAASKLIPNRWFDKSLNWALRVAPTAKTASPTWAWVTPPCADSWANWANASPRMARSKTRRRSTGWSKTK
jgi:hypothetical protein